MRATASDSKDVILSDIATCNSACAIKSLSTRDRGADKDKIAEGAIPADVSAGPRHHRA